MSVTIDKAWLDDERDRFKPTPPGPSSGLFAAILVILVVWLPINLPDASDRDVRHSWADDGPEADPPGRQTGGFVALALGTAVVAALRVLAHTPATLPPVSQLEKISFPPACCSIWRRCTASSCWG